MYFQQILRVPRTVSEGGNNPIFMEAVATTTPGVQALAPLNETMAAAADVQRFDVAAMHEKVSGILATIQASSKTGVAKKHGVDFYESTSPRVTWPRPRGCAVEPVVEDSCFRAIDRFEMKHASYIMYYYTYYKAHFGAPCIMY